MSQDSSKKATYVQLSKPYFTSHEIDLITKKNTDLSENIRNFNSKTKETFQLLKTLIIRLKLPVRILQNSSYFYQKFYLLNNNYKKYANLHFEVGLSVLFISLKLNDYIKKLSLVLSEAYIIKGSHLSTSELEENKKIIISLERKILEFQSFDFRNYLIEDFLIKFLKYYNKEGKINPKSSYLSWSILNDLYLTSLVLQYPAHYNALISIKCSTLIYNELVKQDDNNSTKPIDWELGKLLSSKTSDDSFLLLGCNQLLEYYIDTLAVTFFKNALSELDINIDDKKLADILINIKIEVNNKIPTTSPIDKVSYDDDLFFQTRDTDIAKNGSLRFLYNKEKFSEEVNLYKYKTDNK